MKLNLNDIVFCEWSKSYYDCSDERDLTEEETKEYLKQRAILKKEVSKEISAKIKRDKELSKRSRSIMAEMKIFAKR